MDCSPAVKLRVGAPAASVVVFNDEAYRSARPALAGLVVVPKSPW